MCWIVNVFGRRMPDVVVAVFYLDSVCIIFYLMVI
jgi:hypothetical protein